MSRLIALAVAALALGAWDAEAAGLRLFIGTIPPGLPAVGDPRAPSLPPNDPRVLPFLAPNDPRVLHLLPGDPRAPLPRPHHAPVTHHPHRDGHLHPRVIVVPQPVFIVAPQRQCLIPGFWSHQWVPHTTTTYLWIRGHWSPDGRWVEGHYAPYTVSSGSYQPVWVPERWVC